MLATTTRDHPFDWEEQIRKVCMAYNTSIHSCMELGTKENHPGLKETYSLVRKKLERTHDLPPQGEL